MDELVARHRRAYDAAIATPLNRGTMIGPEVAASPDADIATRLAGLSGRDPGWRSI